MGKKKLTDRDVRIIYLPPSDVAVYRHVGDEPEARCGQVMSQFVLGNNLLRIKPDLRCFGFNVDNPNEPHGYETQVTIPGGMEVPAPLVKKQFEGGLYAAHMIPFGAFEEWGWLDHWMHNNSKYEYRGDGDVDNMYGFFEETLNYFNRVQRPDAGTEGFQLDLLVPIREKA